MARLQLRAEISGNLKSFLAGEETRIARVVTEAVNMASAGLQAELRGQVRAAGLGGGLEKAWQRQLYPSRKAHLGAASMVFSRAVVLHQAYIEGATVLPDGHPYLVIATPEAVAMGYGYSGVQSRTGRGIPAGALRKYSVLEKAAIELGDENLRMAEAGPGKKVVIYTPLQQTGRGRRARGGKAFKVKGGGFQLVRGAGPIVLFILVKQTRVKSVLDLDGPKQRWFDRMYAAMATGIES